MKVITTENLNSLKNTCEKIIFICNENYEGDLMMIQLLCLAEDIKEFINNPIVLNSGILERENS
jgi:hypothetical protein